jgi:phosphoadenosine phosphosulfate reductase
LSTQTDISRAPLNLNELNEEFRTKSPEDILRWAAETFGDRLAVQASMQKTAGVLMHMISRIAPATEVIFVDTGVHFLETLELRDEFQRRYGINVKTYSPEKTFDQQREEFGRDLYLTDDTKPGSEPGYRHCCLLRKEQPFIKAVKGRFDAVAGGLMREEGAARRNTEVLNWDARIEAYKIYPLAFWTSEQVDVYTRAYNLPVHPLYELNFLSIGCHTCTTAVRPGEDRRAGRWRHIREGSDGAISSPLYCGINFEDKGSGI